MRLSYILVIGVLCALYISEKSTAQKKYKPKSIRNCLDLKKHKNKSGSYFITPCDSTPTKLVKVYCDMDTDGGGWTVIQRRDNYTQQENFDNSWDEYAIGFGEVSKDFWLGNDNIHCLTHQSHYEMHIDLVNFEGDSLYTKYDFFYVNDRAKHYQLGVHGYSGNAGDGFKNKNNTQFSTYDVNVDGRRGGCQDPDLYQLQNLDGGWWFSSPATYDSQSNIANLNGRYNYSSSYNSSYCEVSTWGCQQDECDWGTNYKPYYVIKSEMKIRAKYQ